MFSLHYPIFESTRTTVRSSSSLCLIYNLCVVCSMFTCAPWYRPIYFSHHSSLVHCLAALCTDPSRPSLVFTWYVPPSFRSTMYVVLWPGSRSWAILASLGDLFHLNCLVLCVWINIHSFIQQHARHSREQRHERTIVYTRTNNKWLPI